MDTESARESLRAKLPPGSRVSAIIEHVSRSGMSRDVRVLICEDGRVADITWQVAAAIGEKPRNGAIRIGGCGFDARFKVVYNLAYALYPEGFECIGDDCPSNDHVNGDRDHGPHHHASGGYALICDRQ